MAVNKVVYNTENGPQTLIDLTNDSVTPETLAAGATAHDASGNVIVGTMPVEKIPDYVIAEAESVIDRVIQAQGNRTFTFAAITDMHYGSWNYYEGITDYPDGIKHACQALKYIDERIKLDAVAVLGDYTDGMAQTQHDTAVHDFKGVNGVLDQLRFAPNLRLQGNHDHVTKHSPIAYRYIGAYNDGNVVWGNPYGGYFYRDFESYKIRVICLNTTEVSINGVDCSVDQYKWFIESLNLSSKDDVSDWHILVLSHIPLDMWAVGGNYRFAFILDAYKNGTAWSDGTISCDFSVGNNQATVVGNIHGHVHNLKMDKLYLGNIDESSTPQSEIWRIATPNACFGFENKDAYPKYQENEFYIKTANSATDTAFCVYCIDLDTCTIKAICYGAGYDRELVYAQSVPKFTNVLLKAEAYDSTDVYNGVGYKADVRPSTSTGTGETTCTGMYSTGYIPYNGQSKMYLKNVGFKTDSANVSQAVIQSWSSKTTRVSGSLVTDVAASSEFAAVMDGTTITELTIPTWFKEGCAYIRICCDYLGSDSIITLDEEIPEEPKPAYTNVLPLSTDADGSIYNGKGYKENTRWSTSSATEKEYTGVYITGYIQVKFGDTIRLKNITFSGDGTETDKIHYFSDKGSWEFNRLSNECNNAAYDENGALIEFRADLDGYIRVQASSMDSTSIITINEPTE